MLCLEKNKKKNNSTINTISISFIFYFHDAACAYSIFHHRYCITKLLVTHSCLRDTFAFVVWFSSTFENSLQLE